MGKNVNYYYYSLGGAASKDVAVGDPQVARQVVALCRTVVAKFAMKLRFLAAFEPNVPLQTCLIAIHLATHFARVDIS